MKMNRLKGLLQDRGITQTDLAKLLGRDKAVITNLLQGKRQLKADEALQIAEFLNVPLSELMGEPARLPQGFSDTMLIPFQAAPSEKNCKAKQIKERGGAYFLEVTSALSPKAYALEVRDLALNLAGFLPGDVVVAELDAEVSEGDVVVVQHYAGGGAETILRKYQPPLLMPHSTDAQFLPLRADDAALRIVSPVKQLIRML